MSASCSICRTEAAVDGPMPGLTFVHVCYADCASAAGSFTAPILGASQAQACNDCSGDLQGGSDSYDTRHHYNNKSHKLHQVSTTGQRARLAGNPASSHVLCRLVADAFRHSRTRLVASFLPRPQIPSCPYAHVTPVLAGLKSGRASDLLLSPAWLNDYYDATSKRNARLPGCVLYCGG